MEIINVTHDVLEQMVSTFMASAYSYIVIVCNYYLIVALMVQVKHLKRLKICKKGLNLNQLTKEWGLVFD